MKGSDPGRDVLSLRQVMVLLTVALLASVTDLLPSVAARQEGGGGWLIGLGVLPVLLFALWVCGRVLCREELRKTVGGPMGHIIIIVYLIWIVFVLAAVFRLSAARMEDVYGKLPSFCFSVVLAAAAVWMGMGKAAALARAAEIFYLALAVTMAGVLLLALFRIEWNNLRPVEWTGVFPGSVQSAGVLLNVVPMAVLGLRVPPKTRSARRVGGWTAVFCAVITLVLAAVLGCIGSALSARLETPFLIMVQGLGIKGAFQRAEAPVAALWLLSDLILCAALLRAGRDYAAQITSRKWGRRSVPLLGGAALAFGWLLFPSGSVREFCMEFLPVTGLVLGIFFSTFLLVVSCVRAKNRR